MGMQWGLGGDAPWGCCPGGATGGWGRSSTHLELSHWILQSSFEHSGRRWTTTTVTGKQPTTNKSLGLQLTLGCSRLNKKLLSSSNVLAQSPEPHVEEPRGHLSGATLRPQVIPAPAVCLPLGTEVRPEEQEKEKAVCMAPAAARMLWFPVWITLFTMAERRGGSHRGTQEPGEK